MGHAGSAPSVMGQSLGRTGSHQPAPLDLWHQVLRRIWTNWVSYTLLWECRLRTLFRKPPGLITQTCCWLQTRAGVSILHATAEGMSECGARSITEGRQVDLAAQTQNSHLDY